MFKHDVLVFLERPTPSAFDHMEMVDPYTCANPKLPSSIAMRRIEAPAVIDHGHGASISDRRSEPMSYLRTPTG